jgi:hypothetical protein
MRRLSLAAILMFVSAAAGAVPAAAPRLEKATFAGGWLVHPARFRGGPGGLLGHFRLHGGMLSTPPTNRWERTTGHGSG